MIFEQFSKFGVVPIVVIDDMKDALPLAKILSENGLSCLEIKFKAAAEEAIKIISREFPDILVGAGSIMTLDQAERAINAGAKFISCSGINPKIAQYCLDESVPVTPGVQTPTEVEQALELSLTVVNFFPAEAAGGLKMIKALANEYNELKFMPTGGINSKNVRDYLTYEKVIACGCYWITQDLINNAEWDKISTLVKNIVEFVKEVRN